MRKFLLLGVSLSLLIPRPAQCDETHDYVKHLSKIAPNLLIRDYQLLGGDKNDGTPLAGHCEDGCSRLMENIESGQFNFISPVIYTNSAKDFYKALISYTSCRNLGVLSYVYSLDGPAGWSTDDPNLGFFRPTRGFAIYKLPSPYNNILILRGENYASSGVRAHDENSVDMNVKASDMPTTEVGATLGPGEGSFVEVSSSDCMSLNATFFMFKSVRYNNKSNKLVYDNNSWFANPIIYENKVYFLNAHVDYPSADVAIKFTEYYIRIVDVPKQDVPPTDLFFVPKGQ